MKILMVNKFLYPNGGSETYIFKLGEILKKNGHEVQYFGMEHEGRCVSNRMNAYTADMDFHVSGKLSKITYPVKTIYSSEAKKKITLVLEDFQPDVVHLNNFTYQLTPSIICAVEKWRKKNNRECRIVFTAHDYNLVCPNHQLRNPSINENCEKCLGGHFVNCAKGKCIHRSLAKSVVGAAEGYYWKLRKTYRYIDSVICCSRFLKTKMETNPIFRNKTVVLHNFVTDVKIEEPEKKDYVLYFGRYSVEKGIATLIEACRQLKEINFVFAGKGPLEEEVNKVENIKNVGFKSGDELVRLISEARFSVYPSEWYENCPFSVMESQIYFTPVLGADIGGIPELIKDKVTGELFESGNVEELKDRLYALWNDREKTYRYSQNCKNTSFDSVEEYYNKIIKIYEGNNG